MKITAEISLYALQNDFTTPVDEFLVLLKKNKSIAIQIGTMSTTIEGDYGEIMQLLSTACKTIFEKFPSVATIKLSNTCSCETETH